MRLFLCLSLILAVSSCSKPGQTLDSTDPAGAEAGARLYKNYCITCHGLYGNMGASGAFNLTISQLSLEERIIVIRDGRNTMTPFKGLLSEQEIKATAEYSLQLKKP